MVYLLDEQIEATLARAKESCALAQSIHQAMGRMPQCRTLELLWRRAH